MTARVESVPVRDRALRDAREARQRLPWSLLRWTPCERCDRIPAVDNAVPCRCWEVRVERAKGARTGTAVVDAAERAA